MSIEPGVLYVVATPIGNLADLSRRAIETLASVALIAAEDTRHSGVLLAHYGIKTPVISLHEHNEDERCALIRSRLQGGQSVALISDAGTPLISDPGYRLVRAMVRAGVRVSPVPGACALVAALSSAGLPTDRFIFEGFLPSRSQARREVMRALEHEPRTIVFYEAAHRIAESLKDAVEIFGPQREAALARELTKLHETIALRPLGSLLEWVNGEPRQRRGEFVMLISGCADVQTRGEPARVLEILRAELPAKLAVRLAAAITGERRNVLYKQLTGGLAEDPDPE